jgi:seryl-tRNA synthetase
MSDELIQRLTDAGAVTILSVTLVAFCLIFGPALFKLISTLTDFLQKLVDLNAQLVQQAEASRQAIELSYTADQQQTAAIQTNTHHLDATRGDIRQMSAALHTRFDTTDAKIENAAVRVVGELTPLLTSLKDIGQMLHTLQTQDMYLSEQVQALHQQLNAVERHLVEVLQEAVGKPTP